MKNLVRYRAGPLSRRPTIRPIQYFARGNTYIEPEWERSDITYVNTSNIHGVQRSRRNTLGRSEYMKFCWIMSLWIDRVFPWGRRENGSAHYWNALESAPWKLSIMETQWSEPVNEPFCMPFPRVQTKTGSNHHRTGPNRTRGNIV